MSIFSVRPTLRWMVPGIAVAAVLGGTAAFGAVSARAGDLPSRSAAQLLADVQQARLDGLSGTVQQTADLGLPQLPIPGEGGSSNLTSLISGTHTLRVWYAGPDKARVALLGTLGESDIIANGDDVWVWESQSNSATHYKPGTRTGPADLVPKSPQDAAELALKAIDPTTKVTTTGTAKVAGRDAYELVLAPKDSGSLVGEVRIAIDGKEHVPLRVQVLPKGSTKPAIEVGFTQVSFARPDDAQFAFVPPPGAKVAEGGQPEADQPKNQTPAVPERKPATVGTGWTTVVVVAAPPAAGKTDGTADGKTGQFAGILSALPKVSGSWGSGHLLTGRLFSVLVTDDGRLLAGAVTPAALYRAAQ